MDSCPSLSFYQECVPSWSCESPFGTQLGTVQGLCDPTLCIFPSFRLMASELQGQAHLGSETSSIPST